MERSRKFCERKAMVRGGCVALKSNGSIRND